MYHHRTIIFVWCVLGFITAQVAARGLPSTSFQVHTVRRQEQQYTVWPLPSSPSHNHKRILSLFTLRGGSTKKASKKESNKKSGDSELVDETAKPSKKTKKATEIRLSDFQEDSSDAMEDYEEDEGSFVETKSPSSLNKHLASIRDMWDRTPPITQLYVGCSTAITLLSFAFNKNKWPSFLHFDWSPILFQGQFWRLISAFFFLGPLDIFYPLTIQFVWQHMSTLEKLSSQQPEEFALMTLFGAVALIALYTATGVSMKFLGHNLATYFVYLWARLFEGQDVNFMDLFTLKAEMLPWFFCAQTYLLEHEIPIADLIGIAVGHCYHYLTQRQVLRVPQALKAWFQQPGVKNRYARFKEDIV